MDDSSSRFKSHEIVEVVADKSPVSESRVYINEPLAACANRRCKLDAFEIYQYGQRRETDDDDDDSSDDDDTNDANDRC